MDNLLEIQNLTVELMSTRGIVYALSGVDLAVRPGEIHGIVGESGCGKSMTAKSILRLHNPQRSRMRGSIRFEGRELLDLSNREMEKLRGTDISMIFQDPMTSLNPIMTIGGQIADMYRIHTGAGKAEAMEKAQELLAKVGIEPANKRCKQYPFELSGGMQQRVMIAMAIACSPKLLIADEPTTALDVTIQAQILELLQQLSADMGMSILLITHNFGVVAETCDRVSVMYAGKVVETGNTRDLLQGASHPYSRALIRSIPGGKVYFQGQDITDLSGKDLLPLRRNMQMIFQNPYASFNPKQKIGSALREVAKVHKIPSGEAEEKIKYLLQEINLPEDTLNRIPSEMSGGQLQRLAIARALLLDPAFIVADEPVSALDVSVQAQILNLMMDLREKFSLTMLFISHEMTVVRHLCDQVAVMYLGAVMEQAESEELFNNLLHPYTQTLISAIPTLDPEHKKQRIVLQGDLPSAIDVPPGCPFADRCPQCQPLCKESRPQLKDVGNNHLVACHLVG